MKGHTGIHWLAPASMLGALAVGVLFAGGHHLFYRSLDGKPVSHGALFGSSISKQEANVSIGLAFAFLVKACLVFSMSVAFVQLFWRGAKAPHPRHIPTLARLDSLHSAFNNVWALVDVRVWVRSPLPFIIAALAWIVPIASIISPATLSIRMAAVTPAPESVLRVPNLDFGSMNFLAPMPAMAQNDGLGGPTNMASYLYNGPSQAVLEISNAVMAGGEILQINPPAPNASWVVDFVGPSLQCNNVSPAMHQRFRQNIAAGLNVTNGAELFGYLAWFPTSGWIRDNLTDTFPFMSEAANGKLQFDPGEQAGLTLGNVTLYLAALPDLFGATANMIVSSFSPPYEAGPGIPDWVDGTMVECVLYNSTYHAAFDYVNGEQRIVFNVTTHEEAEGAGQLLGPNPDHPEHDPCENTDTLPEDQAVVCYNNREALQALSYVAMMDAVGDILKGSVAVDGQQQMNRSSNVLSTSLLNTQDLSFLRKAAAVQLGNNTLQSMIAPSNKPNSKGLVNNEVSISTVPLHSAVEQMFQKVTISLMSSAALRPNYSSISAPDPVKVTLPAYRNIYVYSAFKLWAAYGAAIFLALLTVLLGLVVMFLNGVSYSANFSAVFLAARAAVLSEMIRERDLGGEDPLPKYLKGAQVSFEQSPAEEKDLHFVRSRDR